MMHRKFIYNLIAALLICGCSDSSNSSSDTDVPGKEDPGKEDPGKEDPGKEDPGKEDPGKEDPGKTDPSAFPDADGDTICDSDEGRKIPDSDSDDTDGDTIPDYLDDDSDDDGIPDRIEAWNDGNPANLPAVGAAGVPAFRTKDADDNGILDIDEVRFDKDGKPSDIDKDGLPDFISDDNDGDGASDVEEIVGLINPDTGRYGMDCDKDGVVDEPGSLEHPLDCDGDTIPDYNDTDSDGDTIEDKYEGYDDSNKDGILDRYSLDSDGDTIPDEKERGNGEKPADSDGDGIFDFQEYDSDNDGLPDALEVICPDGSDSRITSDVDGDGESDLAEYGIAKRFNVDPAALICDKSRGVTDYISFFFELPRAGDEKFDTLTFNPQVTKADIFINVDNTGSMESAIDLLKENFISVVRSAVRERVKDSAFGVSIFGDTDAQPAWQLYSPITENDKEFEAKLKTLSINRGGTDEPEAGYEALYEIATGDNQNSPKAYEKARPAEGTIGGAGFRVGALPIILHITDAPASDKHGRSKKDAMDALHKIGARVIPLATRFTGKNDKGDWPALLTANSIDIAKESKSVVPVCAYQQNDKSWGCGENKCCTSDYFGVFDGGEPDSDNTCALAIQSGPNVGLTVSNGSNALLYKTVLAIEALVKYSTYDVSTRVVGEPILEDERAGEATTTACFIKRIEAVSYVPPENGVVTECMKNFDTKAIDSGSKGYNDAFTNFAVGAATPESPKSKLTFKVVAQNDNCVKKSTEVRSYKVNIEVYDPKTGMLFDKHEVMIIVPGEPRDYIN